MTKIITATKQIDIIRSLEDSGVLTGERCPTPSYWNWGVLKPDELPLWLREQYQQYGEIRWYAVDLEVGQ